MLDDNTNFARSRPELYPSPSGEKPAAATGSTARPARWMEKARNAAGFPGEPRHAEAEASSTHVLAPPSERFETTTVLNAVDGVADGDAVLVSLGAESTAEMLRARSAMTRVLVEAHGFLALAIDAPDQVTRQLDRWVNGLPCEDQACLGTADPALGLKTRAAAELFQWLQTHNAFLPEPSRVRVVPAEPPDVGRAPTVIWGTEATVTLTTGRNGVLRHVTLEPTQKPGKSVPSWAGTFDDQACSAIFHAPQGCSGHLRESENGTANSPHLRLMIAGRTRPRPIETADPRHPIPRSFLFGL